MFLFKKKSKSPPPAWLQGYFEAKDQMAHSNADLDQIEIIALDTETTGLNVDKDRLLSIGAIKIKGNAVLIEDSLELILYSQEEVNSSTIPIHGLRPADLKTGIQAEEALKQFIDFLGNRVILAHHTGFDVAMLSKAIRSFYPAFRFYNHQLDTMRMAIQVEHTFTSGRFINRREYSLDKLCKKYEIEPLERHTAWGDAYTTALLYLRLADILKKRGNTKLKDIK